MPEGKDIPPRIPQQRSALWIAFETLQDELQRCRNSVAEASLTFPNVGEYIAKLETDISRRKEQAARPLGDVSPSFFTSGGTTTPLERCVAALRSIAGNGCCDQCQEAALVAKSTLGALGYE